MTYPGWRAKLTREQQRWPWLATTVGRVDAYLGWRAYLERERQNYRLGLSPLEPLDAYLLVYIRDHRRAKGRPPTLAGIAAKMRWPVTKNMAWRRVAVLKRTGWLEQDTKGQAASVRLSPKARGFLEGVK